MSDDDLGLASVQPSLGQSEAETPRGSWPSERFVLTLWALLTVAAAVVFLATKEQNAVDDPVQKAARGEVTGLGPLSLLRADRFADVLGTLRAREPRGSIMNLRLDPTRADVRLRTPGFKLQQLQVDTGLKVRQVSSGETTEKALSYARIDPAVPERLVRAVNERTGTTPDDIGYLSISVNSARTADSLWTLTLTRGIRPDRRSYTANLDGSHLKGNG